jgi:3-methyladenine DNA glycosylase AlkD
MDFEMVMQELESLGSERTKKSYIRNGAHEPLFGVPTGKMKPLAKKFKNNQPLAEQLYSTGNYDAMYFAGIIANIKIMTESDFERWIDGAYFYMLSDFVASVTLAETEIAQAVADKWIANGVELRMSAGWSCYCWLLGNRPDTEFNTIKLSSMLDQVEITIHDSPDRTKSAMNNFIYTVGVSYLPLHDKAVETANAVGPVEIKRDNQKSSILLASESIQKHIDRSPLGFKRKHVRC